MVSNSIAILSESESASIQHSIRLARASNSDLYLLDGTRCGTEDELFREFAIKLAFPSYFGGNWNAFIDCMRSFPWEDRRAIVLCIDAWAILGGDEQLAARLF